MFSKCHKSTLKGINYPPDKKIEKDRLYPLLVAAFEPN